MAISTVNGNTASANNAQDPSVDMSTWGLQENDLVIAALAIGNSLDLDVTMNSAGYTEIADLNGPDTHDANLGVFYKFMTATPDSTAVGEGGTDPTSGVVLAVRAFRGVDTGSPFDVTSTTATGSNTMIANPPSIDWSTAGVWTVIAAAASTADNGLVFTFPSGYTTNALQQGQLETEMNRVALGYNSSPSDPEDPAVFGINISDDTACGWAAVTMALRPAAGGGTTDGWGIPIF